MTKDFQLFGDRSRFAIEVRLVSDPHGLSQAPDASRGSWGEWRIWVTNVNLCRMQITTEGGPVEADGVRWYLAPLLRWLVSNWNPLLHETRLPSGAWRGERTPRWARTAYLSMLEVAGDEDRFQPWHDWASRHALRFGAEGGVLPDIFFQRIGDDIELSWGDRIDPGTESVTFTTEDGVARTSVNAFASAFFAAVDWLLAQHEIAGQPWARSLADTWARLGNRSESALAWYLDGSPDPGPLSNKLTTALKTLGKELPVAENDNNPWIDTLAPQVAMFGDLSPNITQGAATTLLAEYFAACRNDDDAFALADQMAEDEPAWAVASPWDNGYALAIQVLDEVDPSPRSAKTQIEKMLLELGVRWKQVSLGEAGPRGVAIAGEELVPTILVNEDHVANRGRGLRFTLAHELCHILFDRKHARTLAHPSTPWAPPSVEQRANAFAAMLLMPPFRARVQGESDARALKAEVDTLAETLGVSRGALRYHLANIGEISPYQFEQLTRRYDEQLH